MGDSRRIGQQQLFEIFMRFTEKYVRITSLEQIAARQHNVQTVVTLHRIVQCKIAGVHAVAVTTSDNLRFCHALSCFQADDNFPSLLIDCDNMVIIQEDDNCVILYDQQGDTRYELLNFTTAEEALRSHEQPSALIG